MTNTPQGSLSESADEIRIVGINTDKTRRIPGSETHYHVYFKLSETPAQVWRIIFLDQWKVMPSDPATPWAEAAIDGDFLRIDCPLGDLAPVYFPALKKSVAKTNEAYTQRVRDDANTEESREKAWKQERKAVEDVAALLHFD
jgi:hypothetical protein